MRSGACFWLVCPEKELFDIYSCDCIDPERRDEDDDDRKKRRCTDNYICPDGFLYDKDNCKCLKIAGGLFD